MIYTELFETLLPQEPNLEPQCAIATVYLDRVTHSENGSQWKTVVLIKYIPGGVAR